MVVQEKAFALNEKDSRILMELDPLYKRLNYAPEYRLHNLEKYPDLTEYSDDLYLERVSLYNKLGQYDIAYKLIMSRKFHPWEGGEGNVDGQYIFSLIEMAKITIEANEYVRVVDLLKKDVRFAKKMS